MELRVLRYFLAVAREESISGAAEFLHVTQPTLSRQLMDLEKDLGKTLLIRGKRKVSLTDEGMLLRKRAEEIIELADKTEAELSSAGDIVSGDVYIGGGESDAMRLICGVVSSFQKDCPHVRYHLFSGNAEDVTDKLDKGLIDFGILIDPADIRKYNFLRIPAADVWGVLMRKESPLAAKDTICAEDLWELPIICSRQVMARSKISEWLGRGFEQLNVVATYNLLYNASLMVSDGFGYALCLDKIVNTTGDSPLCFRPLEPRVEVGLDIVWKKYQIFSKAAEKFLERIQKEFAE